MNRIALAVLGLLASGCAAPITHFDPVDPALVQAEEARQKVLAIATIAEQQQRLERVGWPILRRAVSLCEVTPRFGLQVGTDHVYESGWRSAAREVLGVSDTLTVISVIPGSPADSAGARVGDRILFVDGFATLHGARAPEAFSRFLRDRTDVGNRSLELRVARGAEALDLHLEAVDACPDALVVIPDGSLNAFADGDVIYVTSAMMRFAEDDELAVIIGHELAHNAMGHIDAGTRNAMAAGFLGLLVDVALASQGVETEGSYMSEFAALGSMTFSQDFEREADYVGLYAMALAGYPLDRAPTFWRHMAIANPGSIQLATSHPTPAERFVRLEQTIAEIEGRRARGERLSPDLGARAATIR